MSKTDLSSLPETSAGALQGASPGVPTGDLVRRPVVRRGEYWVFSLLNPAGKLIGSTWGGILAKTSEVPATLAFKGRAPGLFESAVHGVVIYRQPNR